MEWLITVAVAARRWGGGLLRGPKEIQPAQSGEGHRRCPGRSRRCARRGAEDSLSGRGGIQGACLDVSRSARRRHSTIDGWRRRRSRNGSRSVRRPWSSGQPTSPSVKRCSSTRSVGSATIGAGSLRSRRKPATTSNGSPDSTPVPPRRSCSRRSRTTLAGRRWCWCETSRSRPGKRRIGGAAASWRPQSSGSPRRWSRRRRFRWSRCRPTR